MSNSYTVTIDKPAAQTHTNPFTDLHEAYAFYTETVANTETGTLVALYINGETHLSKVA